MIKTRQQVSVLFMLFSILFCVWYLIDGRAHRLSNLLHHQRLCLRGVGISEGTTADMDGVRHELLLRVHGSVVRLDSGCPLLDE